MDYIAPTATFTENAKPLITQWYATTYKGVDKFDQQMANIEYPWKVYDQEFIQIIAVLRMLVTDAWVLYCANQERYPKDMVSMDLKQFAQCIAEHLVAQEK